MRCGSCGTDCAVGARYCASCGSALSPVLPHPPVQVQVQLHMPAAMAEPPQRLGGHALALSRGMYCPHCHQRTTPVPFFSRGINVAKLVALLPFTVVGPILFLLLRKDRVVCSWCRALLPTEVPTGLLGAFAMNTSESALALAGGSGAALVANEQVSHEIAHHEARGRRLRRRAGLLGAVTVMMAALGGSALADHSGEGAVALFSMSGVAGLGAAMSSRRGKRHALEAAGKRQRQRVLEVLSLARRYKGRLTVTAVASEMSLDLVESEVLLDSMLDGRRVDVQVDDQGRMTYVFPELL